MLRQPAACHIHQRLIGEQAAPHLKQRGVALREVQRVGEDHVVVLAVPDRLPRRCVDQFDNAVAFRRIGVVDQAQPRQAQPALAARIEG